MFDWFSSDSNDAIGILKADHDRVKKFSTSSKTPKPVPPRRRS